MNIVIAGTGKITERMMEAASKIEGLKILGVMSRSAERGKEYAIKHGLQRVYTSIEEAAKDSQVDAVYIATPNICHGEQAITALRAGKHVLCEKPIASDYEEAKRMYDAARENRTVLLEAMRSIFDPGFLKIQELIPCLGTIRRVSFQMNQYSSRYDNFKQGVIENAFQPSLANAAVMDLGVYCIHPCVRLFGMPQSIQASSIFLENGMEGMGTAVMSYSSMLAELQYSKLHDVGIPSQIQGEKGILLIDKIQDPSNLTLIPRGGRPQEFLIDKESNNMYYELKEFVRLVQNQCVEHEYIQSSLDEMQVVDKIKELAGITFTV